MIGQSAFCLKPRSDIHRARNECYRFSDNEYRNAVFVLLLTFSRTLHSFVVCTVVRIKVGRAATREFTQKRRAARGGSRVGWGSRVHEIVILIRTPRPDEPVADGDAFRFARHVALSLETQSREVLNIAAYLSGHRTRSFLTDNNYR